MPNKGSKVYGLVSKITAEQLNKLDVSEDVPTDYLRVALKVKKFAEDLGQPKELTAWVYVGADESRFINNPKNVYPTYEKRILTAAKNENLPEEYVTNYLTLKVDSPYFSPSLAKVSAFVLCAGIGSAFLVGENYYGRAISCGLAICGSLLSLTSLVTYAAGDSLLKKLKLA